MFFTNYTSFLKEKLNLTSCLQHKNKQTGAHTFIYKRVFTWTLLPTSGNGYMKKKKIKKMKEKNKQNSFKLFVVDSVCLHTHINKYIWTCIYAHTKRTWVFMSATHIRTHRKVLFSFCFSLQIQWVTKCLWFFLFLTGSLNSPFSCMWLDFCNSVVYSYGFYMFFIFRFFVFCGCWKSPFFPSKNGINLHKFCLIFVKFFS